MVVKYQCLKYLEIVNYLEVFKVSAQGWNQDDVKLQHDLLIKANKLQLSQLSIWVFKEIDKRKQDKNVEDMTAEEAGAGLVE